MFWVPIWFRKSYLSADISSLSSFNSDTDSSCMTPIDDPSPSKVKDIISIFQQDNDESHPQSGNKTLGRNLSRSLSNSEAQNVKDIAQKFEQYIKQVPKYSEPKFTKTDPLFYSCLIVERSQDVAHIKYKFPKEVDVPLNIEQLCFPETDMITVDSSKDAQTYSMVLTNDKGERMFGYCRRVMPEGSTRCLPLAYCILSKHRSPKFYKKVLEALESRHGLADKIRDELISQFYNQPYPEPGKSITIDLLTVYNAFNNNKENHPTNQTLEESLDLNAYVQVNKTSEYGSLNAHKKSEKIFVCDHDIQENCTFPSLIVQTEDKIELELMLHPNEITDLTTLHKLPVPVILKVFSSLLLERKVIVISSNLSDLSQTIDALQSILSPFVWQHTVIPVLPEALWTVVESPTPVICGCLSKDVLEEHVIDNGIVVDLDRGHILKCDGDEDKIMSNSMKKELKKAIQLATSKKNLNQIGFSETDARSKKLAESYLRVFSLFMNNYRSYCIKETFHRDQFIQNGKTKGIRKFLELFTQTFMFQEFVNNALKSPGSSIFG